MLNTRILCKRMAETHLYEKSGWLTLLPVQNQNNLVKLNSFTFPLYFSQQYSIGSDIQDDLTLPDIENNIFSAVIRVETFKVVYESNDSIVTWKKNEFESVRSPLIAVIQLGPFKYKLCKCFASTAPNSQFSYVVTHLAECVVCMQFWDEPSPLPCGHVTCQSCLNYLVNGALDIADQRREQLLRGGPYSYQPPKIKCGKCYKEMPISEISVDATQPVLRKAGNAIEYFLYKRPICSHCSNVRCLANISDYWKCRTCKCDLCPLCALELHSDHAIDFGYSVVTKGYMNFNKQTLSTLMQFGKQKIQLDTVSKNLHKAMTILNDLDKKINESLGKLSAISDEAMVLHAKFESLEKMPFYDCTNPDINHAANRFKQTVETFQSSSALAVTKLNKIVAVIQSKKNMEQ